MTIHILHPRWPDGTPVLIGDLVTLPGGEPSVVLWIRGEEIGLGEEGTPTSKTSVHNLKRLLPPRPVAGEMPEELARWLESTAIGPGGANVSDLSLMSQQKLADLFDWAKGLLAPDAEIVEDGEPRCDDSLTLPGRLLLHPDLQPASRPAMPVEDDEPDDDPQCDAEWCENDNDGGYIWTCQRPANHPAETIYGGLTTGRNHFDPERGWW